MRMRRRILCRQDRFQAAFLMTAVTAASLLWGCRPKETSPEPSPAPSPVAACAATDAEIRQWIENPSLPAEPAGTGDLCFYNFAWQEMFAVTQRVGDAPQFATWPNDQELFPAGGDPNPWNTGARPMRVRLLRKGLGLPGLDGGTTADQVTEAAALTPVVDQRGRWAHYSVVVNQPEYEYIRCCELYRGGCFNTRAGVATQPVKPSQITLPNDALELKLAWRVLETCDLPDSPSPCTRENVSRYLTVQGEVQPYSPQNLDTPVKATLGLVGMHIVQRTPQNPNALWMTFEHIDNVPDCPTAAPPSPPAGFAGWNFFDATCDSKDPRCQANQYCPPCPVTVAPDVVKAFNDDPGNKWKIPADGVITCTPAPNEFNRPVQVNGKSVWIHLFDPQTCKAPPIPTQVCRQPTIAMEVQGLNEKVQAALRQLGGSTAGLANYELVGALWFNGQSLQPPPATLANTTMETYLQALPNGCILCHADSPAANPVPPAPPMQFNSGFADRSFVFQQIRQFGAACGTELPASCGAWENACLPPTSPTRTPP